MIETPLVDKLFVGGEWLGSSESGETFDVVNPANGEVLAALCPTPGARSCREP